MGTYSRRALSSASGAWVRGMIELMLIAHRPRSTPPPSPSSPGSAADEGGGCSGVEAMSTMRQRAGSASGAPSVCRGRFDEGPPSAGWMIWRISESGREIPCEASPCRGGGGRRGGEV